MHTLTGNLPKQYILNHSMPCRKSNLDSTVKTFRNSSYRHIFFKFSLFLLICQSIWCRYPKQSRKWPSVFIGLTPNMVSVLPYEVVSPLLNNNDTLVYE